MSSPGSKSCTSQAVLLPWPTRARTCTPVSVHEGHSRATVIPATPASRGRPSNALRMVNDLACKNVHKQRQHGLLAPPPAPQLQDSRREVRQESSQHQCWSQISAAFDLFSLGNTY